MGRRTITQSIKVHAIYLAGRIDLSYPDDGYTLAGIQKAKMYGRPQMIDARRFRAAGPRYMHALFIIPTLFGGSSPASIRRPAHASYCVTAPEHRHTINTCPGRRADRADSDPPSVRSSSSFDVSTLIVTASQPTSIEFPLC